jgi:hypothetical protein
MREDVAPGSRRAISAPLSFMALLLLLTANLGASPWVIVTDFSDRTIHTVDLGANPPQVYGPFLGPSVAPAQLGPVKVLPDQRSAVVGNAYTGALYLLNVADPREPLLTDVLNDCGRLAISGLAVSPDGRFACISDEIGLSMVDLRSLACGWASLFPARPSSVAISPNNSTVILADPQNRQLLYGDAAPSLTGVVSVTPFQTGSSPLKAVIAPDGQTILVGNGLADLQVFRFTPTGIVPGNPPALLFMSSVQSFAFDPGGKRVYALRSPSLNEDAIAIMDIEAPGVVSVQASAAVVFPSVITLGSPVFDMLGITPDGSRLVVGNSLETFLRIVKVADLSVSTVNTNGRFPSAVAVFSNAPLVAVPVGSALSICGSAILLAVVGALKLMR